MSVRIRLRRMGAKKQAFYRVVVADSRSPRDGRFLDTIGTYNPRTVPVAIDLDREKTLRWLAEGALPTDSARSLLSQTGIWQEFKTGVRQEAVPQEAVPQEAVPQEAVPQEAVPQEALPQEFVEPAQAQAPEPAAPPSEPEASSETGAAETSAGE